MAITQVRVELPDDQYSQLIQIQEEIRKTTGRKPSLSSIILTLMEKGIHAGYNAPLNQNVAQNSPKPVPVTPQPLSGPVAMSVSELRNWEFQLRERESEVSEKELALIDLDQTISKKTGDALQIKEQGLNLKESALGKSNEIVVLKMEKSGLEKEVTYLKEQNAELRRNNRFMQEILSLVKSIDRKTEKNFFMDYIAPFLPVLGTAISTILLTKNNKDNKEFSKFDKEVLGIYNNLSPEQQKQITANLNKPVN